MPFRPASQPIHVVAGVADLFLQPFHAVQRHRVWLNRHGVLAGFAIRRAGDAGLGDRAVRRGLPLLRVRGDLHCRQLDSNREGQGISSAALEVRSGVGTGRFGALSQAMVS